MDVLNESEYVISIDKIVSDASTMANFFLRQFVAA
jgi:hypothetical protein